MTQLTLESAQRIIDAALAGGRTGPERRIAVAVCDAGGHPLALGREQDAAPLLAHIAQAKAFTCIAYGKSTDEVRQWAEETPIWFHGVARVAEQIGYDHALRKRTPVSASWSMFGVFGRSSPTA